MLKLIFIVIFTLTPLCIRASAQEIEMHVLYNHDIFKESSRSYKVAWTLFERAAIKNNIKLSLTYSSWFKSLKLLNENKIDSTLLAFYTEKRAEKWSYSVPVSLDTLSIYKDVTTQKKDFEEASIGVHKGSIHAEIVKSMGFKAIYESNTRTELHRMLKAERIDYILENESLIDYFCTNIKDTLENSCLMKVGTPISQEPLYIIYNNKDERVNTIFNTINTEIINNRSSKETKDIFLNAGYALGDYTTWQTLVTKNLTL
jgi:ABC-type amino acid transport substrate-binding protein